MKHSSASVFLAVFTSLFLLCATTSLATDYYVNVNTGKDANSGLSADDAWRTITYATSVIEAGADEGSVIHVAPGTYSPSSGEVFPLGGPVLLLEGEDQETVIIDAQRTDTVFSHPSAISGVTIRGGYTDYVGGGVSLISAYNCVLHNCIIEDNVAGWGGGVFVGRASAQIYDCIFRNNTGLYGAGGAHLQEELDSRLVRCQFISNNPWGALVTAAEVTDCAFVGNSPGGLYLLASAYYSDHVIANCLFVNNGNSAELGTGALVKLNSTTSGGAYEVLSNCTFAGNSGPDWKWGNGLCVSYMFYYYLDAVKALNCVFRDGGSEIWEIEPGMVVVENCCVEGGWDGKGQNNFDADPLFVSGPLGDYYLSQTAAGQAVDSPCVDAGSMTALEARMSDKGTRADGLPDGGTVDLGYHYPIAPIGPEVCVSTSSDTYSHGDTLEIMFTASNPNPYPYPVDVYAAVITTDGVICVYSGRWGWGIAWDAFWYFPWFASLEFPANLTFGPTTLLTIALPSAAPPISEPGTYWAAAAFAHVGTMAFIGAPSLSAFELTGD